MKAILSKFLKFELKINMNIIKFPCTITQIEILTGDEHIVNSLLILNDDELYIHYNGASFAELDNTKSAFIADVEFKYKNVEYIFELQLTPKENCFKIIPDKEYQEMKTILLQINLNSKILPNNKKTKTSKI